MGSLHFDITADDTSFQRKIKAIEASVKNAQQQIERSGQGIDETFRNVSGNVEQQAGKIESAFKRAFADAGAMKLSELKSSISTQVTYLKELEQKYKDVSNAVKNLKTSPEKTEMQGTLKNLKKEIDEEKAALDGLRAKYSEMTSGSVESFRTKLMQITNQLMAMRLAGEQNTQEYRELEKEMGRLATVMREVQQTRIADSTGATQWQGMIQGMQGLMGAYSVGSGIVGMFTKDQEKLMQIQTKMQSVMGVLIGMQQVANTLHSTSTFRLRTLKAVTDLWNAANTKAAAGLRLLGVSAGVANVAAKALMATLSLGLSVAIGAVIGLMNKLANKNAEARKKAEESAKAQQEAFEKYADAVSSKSSGVLSKLEALRQKYVKLGDDLKARKKFIADNADAFNDLGVQVRNVHDADNLFIDNTEAFKQAVMIRAQALAGEELAAEKFKEAIEKRVEAGKIEVEDYQPNLSSDPQELAKEKYKELGRSFSEALKTTLNNEADRLEAEAVELITGTLDMSEDARAKLREAGLNSVSGKTSAEKAELKKRQNEYESARKAYNDFIIAQQKKLNDEEEALERSRITNKIELIEFDRKKTIEAIDEEEAAFIKLAEAYNKLAEAQGKPKVAVDTSEFARRRDIANMVASDDTAQALQEEKEAMNAYLAEYGSYQEKRLAITQTYADKIAQARTQGEKLSLQKEQEEALQALDLSMVETSNLWIRLFKDADAMANPSINRIIEDTERLLEYIDRVKGGKSADTSILDALGLSKKQVDALIADPEKIKDILDALKAKRDALNTRNPFGALIQGFKDLKDAAGDADKQMAAINKIIAGAQGAVQMLGDLGGSMSELGEAIGSDFVSGFGSAMSEIADVAGKTLNGALTGEALGGPVGAIIGAGVGLVTGIVSNISKRIAYNNKIRKEYQDTLRKEYLAEYEINALYRERYEWAKKIGEDTLSHLNRNTKEVQSQSEANRREQEELWAKLMGSDYVSSERYKHGTWFRKAKVIKGYSTLAGKSWEDIELLAAQGKLTEEAQGYYEALKKAREEGEELKARMEQIAEETREAFTGIGFDSLVDGIVDGFKEGKRSAADFADDFEELMQNAVLQALKMNALEYPLRQWYEDFADAADDDDGLTAEEIKQLKAKYESIIRSAADQLEQLEGITGVDIETARQQASSNEFQTMSQDTGNELKGRFTAIAEYTANIRDTVNSILLQGGQQLNETINIRDIAIQLNGNVAIIKSHTSHLEEMDDKLGRMVKIMNEKL